MARGDSTFIDSFLFFPRPLSGLRYPFVVRAIGNIYLGLGKYHDGATGNDGYARSFGIDANGNIDDTYLAELHFTNVYTGHIRACQVEEGLVLEVNGPEAGAGAGYVYTFSVDLAGNITTTDSANFAPQWNNGDLIPAANADRVYISCGAAAEDDEDYGTLVTFTIAANGTITVNPALEFTSDGIGDSRICHLVDDLYVLVYVKGPSEYCDMRTFRVSATGVLSDLGAVETIDTSFGVNFNSSPTICKVNDEMVVLVFRTQAVVDGQILTIEVNNTTGAIGTSAIDRVEFLNDFGKGDILPLGNDLFVLGFNEAVDNLTLKVYTFDITPAGEITLLDPMSHDGLIGVATGGDPVWLEQLPNEITVDGRIHNAFTATYRTSTYGLATRTFMVDTGVQSQFVCTESAGMHNFEAQMLGDATGTLLQWDLGRSCPTCSGDSAATCKVTIQYSTDGTPHQAPNTPPYVVRDMIQPQCTQRALWHPNTTHTNHYYSAWVYYDTFNRWMGPYNPSVTPTLPALSGSIEPFHSGSLSYTKLGTNTKLAARQDIVTDVIVWLPESQDGRAPAIDAALQAISPAHSKLTVLYERYYVAQTTTDQFNESDIDATVYDIRNGMIVNKKATIDSSYGGQADILGD